MLELRPNCEHCNKSLDVTSEEAMICTFECTFCKDCVDHVLHNVCPNCGGGFEKRPIRPKEMTDKYPGSKTQVLKPVSGNKFLEANKNINPAER